MEEETSPLQGFVDDIHDANNQLVNLYYVFTFSKNQKYLQRLNEISFKMLPAMKQIQPKRGGKFEADPLVIKDCAKIISEIADDLESNPFAFSEEEKITKSD